MVSLDGFKGIALGAVFATALLGAALPCLVERRCGGQAVGRRRLSQPLQEPTKWTASRVIGVLNAASAGLFVAAGVMHLLADALANEALSEYSRNFWGDGHDHDEGDDDQHDIEGAANWALCLCLAGFFFLLLVEAAMHRCNQHSHGHGAKHSDLRGGLGNDNTAAVLLGSNSTDQDPTGDVGTKAVMNMGNGQMRKPSVPAVLMIMFGLSFHAFMEGLVLGAQTTVEHAASVLIAIVAHKALESFALSNQVSQLLKGSSHELAKLWGTMVLFALVSPVGIGFSWGIAATAEAEESVWAAAFSAFGAGTFLFIATVELIPHEMAHDSLDIVPKAVAMLMAAVAMVGLAKTHVH